MAVYKVIIVSSEKMELHVLMNYASIMLDTFYTCYAVMPKICRFWHNNINIVWKNGVSSAYELRFYYA